MAANPRIVATTTFVTWDGGVTRVAQGTIVDIPAGSTLETAYGGTGNLISIGATAEATDGDPGTVEPFTGTG
jgi:hypothetical protein